jgi:3-deoxy-D-manno-octulosonic-acid transferase
MWILYQAAVALALLLAGPWLLLSRGRHYLASLPRRLGRYAEAPAAGTAEEPGPLWVHAVSVGEVGVAATLARALPGDLPLLVTTITPTGQERARSLLGDRAAVAYLPFDLGFAVHRFFERFRPRALVLAEGDLWPLLLRGAKARGLPVTVVNGRVSDQSFRRMRRLRALLGPLLSRVDRFAVQSAEDAHRLAALGVPATRLTVTGNLKFETAPPDPQPALEGALREVAGGRPILVAGSTMAGEEEEVLAAFAAAGGGERALLLLAPRHPERCLEVEGLAARRGFRLRRRSRLPEAGGRGDADVLLLDTVGELAALYRLAAGAFVGGTLVPTGGHNPLEPARFAVPVVAGPAMENFRDIARAFDAAGAWARVEDAAGLARVWREWLGSPETARELGRRGAALLEAHRGALRQTLELLAPAIAAARAA